MKLAVIVITYNSSACINKCITSVLESVPDGVDLRLVVIDNNSTDETIKILDRFKDHALIELLPNDENLGFARSVNQGLLHVKKNHDPEFYLLLNPDAYLADDCLEHLINYARQDQSLGLVSPHIIDPQTNRSWFRAGNIDWLRLRTKHGHFACEYLSGCAMLIKKDVLGKTGLFDENFFLYYEDADFCLRARKNGFGLGLARQAVCFHKESQSSNFQTKTFHLSKSAMLFFYKHYPIWAKPYFWVNFWLRKFYHRFISGKKPVFEGLKEFSNMLRSSKKAKNKK